MRSPFPVARTLRTIYKKLYAAFGPQHWWPGDTPFEVAIGAILTQNTAWANAAKAISRLKQERMLDPVRLSTLPKQRLATLVRSSGYFNQKAQRLKIFVGYLLEKQRGKIGRMRGLSLNSARRELLELSGIGPETADSILLYALEKPTFVIDAYTRRILARHSLISWDATYEEIRSLFLKHLPPKSSLFNEYHALLVALGKELCRTHPRCHLCPLQKIGRLRLETTPARI